MAFAGKSDGNQRSITATGKPKRTGALVPSEVSSPNSRSFDRTLRAMRSSTVSMRAAVTPIKLKIKGKETRMTQLEAMLLQLKSHAVNGDRRAIKIYLERVAKARWRKNGYKVEEEEAIDLPWTPEMEKLCQSINWDDEGKAVCDADEDKPTAPASPDNAPQAHTPVTIPTKLKENDHA